MNEWTAEAAQTLIRQALYLLRAYERDTRAAIADGRLPEGHCQNAIFTKAPEVIRAMNARGDTAAALECAMNTIDAYRCSTMSRVNDGRENVIDDTVHDLPRLPGMDAEARRLWFNSLGDRERKELLEACSTYIGIAIGAPWANLFKQWKERRK